MIKKVAIFGVPLDLGAQKLGVEMGPSAIRYAGLHSSLEFNGIEYKDYGDTKIKTKVSPVKAIQKASEELASLVLKALQDGYTPVILGGDHSVSIGSIAGVSKYAKNPGVIWLDYHPDSNTPEASPSGNIHGMPVAISLGYGYPELVGCAGFQPKIRPENIVIVGAHDIDPFERKFLTEIGVKMFTLFDIDREGIFRIMDDTIKLLRHCDHIHVSFDVDVLNPLIAPGTGISSKGGLSYREISYIMEVLAKEDFVNSIDIIEVNPLLDIKNMTAELAVELLLSALGGAFGDYQRNYLLQQKPK